MSWPEWWQWELELSPHLLKRMMERATGFHEDDDPGRWVLKTAHESRPWEVIVEPDSVEKLPVVITAYPSEEP